jgi:hypothetical protein
MQISAMTSFVLIALAARPSSQGQSLEEMPMDRSIVKSADAYLKAVLAGDVAAVGATYRKTRWKCLPAGRR